MKQWIYRCLFGLALLPTIASANDGIYKADISCDYEGICALSGESVTITWDIASEDVGRSGAIYVAVQMNDDEVHYFSANGWSNVRHNAYNYFDAFRKLPSQHTFTMFQWGTQGGGQYGPSICAQMAAKGAGKIDVWLGYGAVQDEAEEFIDNYQSIAVKEQPDDHFRIVFAYEDGRKARKYSQVISVTCPSTELRIPNWPADAPTVRHSGHPERDVGPPDRSGYGL